MPLIEKHFIYHSHTGMFWDDFDNQIHSYGNLVLRMRMYEKNTCKANQAMARLRWWWK